MDGGEVVKRGPTKAEVNKALEDLADIYVKGMVGKARMRTKTTLLSMLHKAAWYGAHCATRSAGMAADRLFDADWLMDERALERKAIDDHDRRNAP